MRRLYHWSALTVCVLVVTSTPVKACSEVDVQVAYEEAASNLRRATRAISLEDMQEYARRAARALSDLDSALSIGCDCATGAAEFGIAASRARRVRDADGLDIAILELNGAVRSFNAGTDMMRIGPCRRLRQ